MAHTSCPVSSAWNQSWVTKRRAATVDLPDWKPHCLLNRGDVHSGGWWCTGADDALAFCLLLKARKWVYSWQLPCTFRDWDNRRCFPALKEAALADGNVEKFGERWSKELQAYRVCNDDGRELRHTTEELHEGTRDRCRQLTACYLCRGCIFATNGTPYSYQGNSHKRLQRSSGLSGILRIGRGF